MLTFTSCFFHIIFSLVWVAEWPPFGKELPTLLAICSLCISHFCIEGGILVLVAPVAYLLLSVEKQAVCVILN